MSAQVENLGPNVRELRKRKGWSQIKLAEALGVSEMTVSRVERGKRAPSVGLLVQLSRALEASVDTLLGPTIEERSTLMHVLGGKAL